MNVSRSKPPATRFLACVLLLAFASSCTTWRSQSGDTQSIIEAKQLTRIRVNRTDGSRVVLENPTIVGDSLVGMTTDRQRSGSIQYRLAVPLDQIGAVETEEIDGGRTALATALAVLGAGALVAVIVAAVAPLASDTLGDDFERQACRRTGKICSCPLVYSWDGETWRLDSGTFGGAITRAAARTDVDNLVYATPTDGVLRLKLANEMNETDYVDALSVLAVDHDPTVTVAPDAAGKLYSIGRLNAPTRAVDFTGRDVLARIAAPDDVNWESLVTGRDSSRTEDIRDGLELTFARPNDAQEARLVIDGHDAGWAAMMLAEWISAHGSATPAWYDSLDTQPRMLQELSEIMAHTGFLGVSVLVGDRWEQQGYIWGASPEIVKRQVFSVDLSRVVGDTVRVRLESAPSFWLVDHVAIDYSDQQPLDVRELHANRAIDHTGRDVRAILSAIDGTEYVMETGDYAELEFNVPPVAPGKTRSYILRSTGWYRIHTPDIGPPQIALLDQLVSDRNAASREAVGRMNDMLQLLGSESR